MELFTPLILACEKLTETCMSLVPPGFFALVSEEQCEAMIMEVLPGLIAANPTYEHLWKCINWGLPA
jgi:hypothetical protein